MIRCIRIASWLAAPHRAHRARRIAHHVRRIVRHVRRAHRAHIVSHVVCYAVAGGMALGGGALIAQPPLPADWAPWPTIANTPWPAPSLLPPSAFVPGPGAAWPVIVPAAFVPIEHNHECDHPNRTTAAWCRKHHHSVPEPRSIMVLVVALGGGAAMRRWA